MAHSDESEYLELASGAVKAFACGAPTDKAILRGDFKDPDMLVVFDWVTLCSNLAL
jgi:hypothetical protein